MKIKTEPSSISMEKTEIPKHKNALAEKYEEQAKEVAVSEAESYERLKSKESNKLPRPTGWRILILPFKMPEKTKGGIFLAQDAIERQQVGSNCGLVLEMGPHCYDDKKRYPEGPWCKKGDWGDFCKVCRITYTN